MKNINTLNCYPFAIIFEILIRVSDIVLYIFE